MALRHMIPLVLAAFVSGALLPRGDEDSHSISIPRGSASQAARVGERAEHGGARGFVSLPIVRAARQRSISKRDSDVELFNISTVSYLVELRLGTPGQKVKVAIDTGSDELWVNPNCQSGDLAKEQVAECQSDGRYNASASSTVSMSNFTSTGNLITYGKGEVKIKYVADNIELRGSGISLKNVQFGMANDSVELNEGILGLGYGQGTNLHYDNFVDQLALQKATNSKAFSIALGSVDATNGGVIIFGGVDTKKFTGNLVSNTILGPQGKGEVNRYWIQMTSVALATSGTSKTYAGGNMPVVLDSGSSLSYLPMSLVSAIASDFGGKYDSSSGFYIVPCSQGGKGGSVDFAFGAVTIKVPFHEFIWNADDQTCVLGAGASDGSGVPLLGDTFLRSAFVVFDQSQNAISLAQYVNCGQNEQNISTSGVNGLAGECAPPSNSRAKNAAGRAGRSADGWLLTTAVLSIALALLLL